MRCNSAVRCAVLGTVFGFLFPLIATIFVAVSSGTGLSLGAVMAAQVDTPLLWIIDTAPFWLGLFAWFAGQRHDRLQEVLETVQQQAIELQVRAEEAELGRTTAEEMSHLKSTLLANMSHELRTPLTGIIGFAAVLADEVDDEHSEFAHLIERSGQRLLETLNSVLDLAQLEGGGITLHPEDLDLSDAVGEATRFLEPLAHSKGLVLRSSGASIPARVDSAALYRVVTNLVSNAIKFTDAGSVTVEVEADANEATLRVRDTGIGIPAAFVPHLFDEFRQASTGFGRIHEGNGLGLTITKRLVDLMGGAIAAESVEGSGTTFTVRIPRIAPEIRSGVDSPASGDGAAVGEPALTGRPQPRRTRASSGGTSTPAPASS